MIKDYTQTFEVRGEKIQVTSPALFDEQTGSLVYDQGLDDQAIEKANDLYREKHDFIFPQQIKDFRNSVGISGRDLAALLGTSPTTIVMYENGALPTESNNRMLKSLIENKSTLRDFFNQNRSSLSNKVQEKIEVYLREENSFEPISIMDIVNWFRVKNIILKKSDEYVDDLTQMKVMKLVYYLQGVALHWFDKPAFNDNLLAWEHGPVVKEIYDVYKGRRTIVDDIDAEIPASLLSNFSNLSNDENYGKLLNFIQERLGEFSAATLRNKTHNEEPWLTTQQNDVITLEKIKKYFDENFEYIF